MKLQVIGVLKEVTPVETKESYKFQHIRISQIGYNQETGEALPEEVYEATIFNKKVEELNVDSYIGKRVLATCWTRSLPREHAGKTFYNLALNCSDIKEV